MRQLLFAGSAAVICLLSLLAGSGIGQAYHLYPITMAVVLAAYAVFPLHRSLSGGYVRNREFFLTIGLVLVVGLWPMLKGNKLQGVEYGWLLLLPYVVGQFKLSRVDVRAIGFACGVSGLVIVAARQFFGIFGQWNKNDIAMAAFMGCAVLCAVPWTTWSEKIIHKVLLVVVTLLVLQLDSRSCLVGLLILIAFSFGVLKPSFFLKKNWLRRLVLVLPLLIAVGTVLFQNSQMFDDINTWSMEYFSKPVFNGRNMIWEHGFQNIREDFWLGRGFINNGYWHNCAITAMTAFGSVGYGLWVWYFENIMTDAREWYDDPCLGCCTAAFLTIMIQQSFELGLISTSGSMLPYLIMGIMLGRMRYLKAHKR